MLREGRRAPRDTGRRAPRETRLLNSARNRRLTLFYVSRRALKSLQSVVGTECRRRSGAQVRTNVDPDTAGVVDELDDVVESVG